MEPRQMKKLDSIAKQVDSIATFIGPYAEPGADLKRLTVRTIETKLKSIAHYDTRYRELHDELYVDATTEQEINEITAALDAFTTVCSDTESNLEQVRIRLQPLPDPPLANNNAPANAHQQQQIRLPKLNLKEFSGGYIQWPEFSDSFNTAVDNRTDLTDSQKLSYLKSVLKGEAASLVSSLKLTDANYKVGLKNLRDRYDDKAAIRDALFEKLFGLEMLKKQTASLIRAFSSKTKEYVQLLKNLGEPTEHWDSILIFVLKRKLDSETRKDWEKHIAEKDPNITLTCMLDFLDMTSRSLENVEPAGGANLSTGNDNQPSKRTYQNQNPGPSRSSPYQHIHPVRNQSSGPWPNPSYNNNHSVGMVTRAENYIGGMRCHLCGNSHPLRACQQYLSMNIQERRSKIYELRLCVNCFSKFHDIELCDKPPSCRLCPNGARHHPSLHQDSYAPRFSGNGYFDNQNPNTGPLPRLNPTVPSTSHLAREPGNDPSAETSIGPEPTTMALSTPRASATPITGTQSKDDEVLLATAIVKIAKMDGTFEPCRALIDSGSQSCTITADCVQRIQSTTREIPRKAVIGIGDARTEYCDKMVNLTLEAGVSGPAVKVEALVMSKITGMLPRRTALISKYMRFPGIELADPNFHSPSKIDLLLGADVYCDIMRTEKPMKLNGLFLQPTVFGWIITGGGKVDSEDILMNCLFDTNCRNRYAATRIEDADLKRFWEVDAPNAAPWSLEEKNAERFYEETHRRRVDGRYEVTLPTRNGKPIFGDSRRTAVCRYMKLEQQLMVKPGFEDEYNRLIQEYLDLGQAEIAPVMSDDQDCYYMPHHPVLKPSSTTTKTRPVWDASAKSKNGKSLNEQLMVGPKIQQDLVPIVTRFRKHRVAFSADIEKMYRQIRIRHEDRDYLRFIWRDPNTGQLADYRMTSVTFGIASSAHHASRTLKQLAIDESEQFPLANRIIIEDIYVDDLLSGADDVRTALLYQKQVIGALATGGFRLRKWVSNHPDLLETIPEEGREGASLNLSMDADESIVRALGVQWHPRDDVISYSVKLPLLDIESNWTKRQMLSEMSRVFDPCGLLAPAILVAKMLFQKTWIAGLEWDEVLPEEIMNRWKTWRSELINLDDCRYERCLVPNKPVKSHQLHGFSDASEAGYGAVGYLRTETVDGEIFARLISSRTKVAPVKRVSLPRLELLACQLLSELMSSISESLEIPNLETFAWTDSTVALCWIKGEPSKWKTFVGNKVSIIHDSVSPSAWRHVGTDQNPADCISRGLMPSDLVKYDLWWHGPTFLTDLQYNWPRFAGGAIGNSERNLVNSESKPLKVRIHVTTKHHSLFKLFDFSDFSKIIRVTAWCLRARLRKAIRPVGALTPDELDYATKVWIKNVQSEVYTKELSTLGAEQYLPNNHSLLPLAPFLGDDGILRVGGRLRESQLSYDSKHQALLPQHHRFTNILIDDLHRKNMHAAPKLLLATLRQKYWIVNGYQTLRNYVRTCVTCKRWKRVKLEQIMGNLPKDRITPAHAFTKSGVDYAGPLFIKDKLGRGCKKMKVWLCYFVCFTTKACHLEAVTSLSTDGFLAAFRRFCARRGRPTDLYSDNGTNFHGADNELTNFLSSVCTNEIFAYSLAQDGVKWHFSPQRSSHFGGIYEAGVKSMKYHLYRTLSNSLVTYEELTTLLCQIEACLNSRPMTPLSSDPNDLGALTPGHFLIGGPMNSVPEPDLTELKLNRLDRWQLVQRYYQDLWNCWSKEYLNTLQSRGKWTTAKENLKIDDLVLIIDENCAPLKWPLARVLQIYPGSDGKVRVATLRTATGIYKRPVVKLVHLFD